MSRLNSLCVPLLRAAHGLRGRSIWYYGAPLWALVLAFATASLLLLVAHIDPVVAYLALVQGSIGTEYAAGLSVARATPLVFTGLAVAIAYRAGLFNIGAEGQLQFGALAATMVALRLGSAPLAIIAGFAAGAIWAAIPGYLRARLQVNEVISTLMLNFVAIGSVVLMVAGPIGDRSAPYPTTPLLPASSFLPIIVPGTPLHAGFVLAVVSAAGTYFFLYRTHLGFKIRAVGLNQNAARHAGFNVAQVMVLAMVVSGGVAGLTGAVEVLGVQHRLGEAWSSGWGFTGIAVAFLARSNPLAVLAAALLYGLLDAGSSNMQVVTGAPGALVSVIEGLPILYLLGILALARRRSRVAIQARVEPAP